MDMSSWDAMATVMTMSDATLSRVERPSRAGETEALVPMDEEAFRAFYERTARPLWAYLSRLTGDGHAADDLVQESFYRFYRAGAVHESEAHRRNSLFRIATNLARDHRRRLRRHPDVPMPDDASMPRSPTQLPDDRTDLGRAISRLAPLQRELIWLAYGQGFSHDEIAGVTGVKSGDVKSLLYRTRKKLADLLRKGGWNRG
jgi:RNA polymerase sigma-70 factor (ECF subfamily)